MLDFKVVFHVSEKNRWPVAITNVKNFLADTEGKKVAVTIVANAEAVTAQDIFPQLEELAHKGVEIAFCNNALRAFAVPKETLPSFIKIVPAGITALVQKQKEGYAYIKP
ncbi:DsrE family protein [Ammonifex thiophilus]|uniref:Uncharacterized protein n=1 Tax=Ammonifex thiophilus TaxID=444093 RepID=A0A3D8P0W6_9THEO|nr:DsrE family protein [Ammonifex thiophilus]RDV80716.1 hypothetical protein DXX99_10610 [Ammonifex thiophilus]